MSGEGANMSFSIKDIPKQYHFVLDEIWSCNTDMDLFIYINSCGPQKKRIAENLIELINLEMIDKNFDIACQLADDLYFKFMDNLSDDIVSEFVIDDKDNIGSTKNTEKGSNLYWELESTIKNALDKQTESEE